MVGVVSQLVCGWAIGVGGCVKAGVFGVGVQLRDSVVVRRWLVRLCVVSLWLSSPIHPDWLRVVSVWLSSSRLVSLVVAAELLEYVYNRLQFSYGWYFTFIQGFVYLALIRLNGFDTKQMVNPWNTYVKLSAVLMGSHGLTKGSLAFLNYPA
ncbi:hypothetical protein Droror1_Dr00025041 [Drosera rotundifolia]